MNSVEIGWVFLLGLATVARVLILIGVASVGVSSDRGVDRPAPGHPAARPIAILLSEDGATQMKIDG